MHKPSINPAVVQRVTARRGGLRVFDTLVPERTAHVVVDLQNGFMAPGAVCEIDTAREIVPTVNRISAALREAGGLIVYLQNTINAETLRSWSTYFDYFCSPARRQWMIDSFTAGSEGHALWAGLDVQRQDIIVPKTRFGAFAPGASDLHAILQEKGVDTLIITGTASQVCCESTARDAMMLNYKVFFVDDANATFTDQEHNSTLSAMAHTFCDVIGADALLALMQVGAKQAAPAMA